MTADCIVSEIETESHYIKFKCVQCGVSGFVERTQRPRIRCSIKCNNKATAEKTKAETAKRRAERKAEAERIKASKPAPTEKTCSTCGQTKPVSEFHKKSDGSPDGYSSQCKVCRSASQRKSASRPEAKEKKAEYLRKKMESDAAFRAKRLQTQKLYRLKNPGVPENERVVVLHQAHVYAFMRLHLHSEHVSRWMAYRKECRILHDAHVRALRGNDAANFRFRYKTEPNFALYHKVKNWMHKHIKQKRDSRKWAHILGYTPEELRTHLEKQFTKGMSWENQGALEVDHVLPVASFDIKGFDDPNFYACYGLHNLRPIWKKENRDKRDKILFLL